MVIARRVLTLRRARGDVAISIRIRKPERHKTMRCCICRFEIPWPERTIRQYAAGEDAVQALELALKMIGALIYTSRHHKSGRLMWLEPGQGYGFPVPRTIRDLLVGDDRKLL